MRRLRIALVAAEVAPFAKTGGLADVAAGLPRYLGRAGHDVRVFMPFYDTVKADTRPVGEVADVGVLCGVDRLAFSLRTTPLPDSDVPVHLVDCPALYARGDVYTQDPDEATRFAFLCRATLESCQRTQWTPDVIHLNDWHTGLLPIYLKTVYAWDRLFERTRTLLTIHNIGYQGTFDLRVLDDVGLGDQRQLLPQDDVRQHRVNMLKTGLLFADRLTTVSRTYADEIQTPEFGAGLDQLLRARRVVLSGIVNGVDYGDWNPETDPLIPERYSARDLSGKAACKRALCEGFDLAFDPRAAVIGVVSRLTPQKGFELLPDLLPVLLREHDVRLVVLGSGEERYESYFQWLRDAFPDRVAFYRGYNNELAHRIEAGADLFVMPSRYEPCGLNQMYSLRYGTVPLVRRTGGLADTVEPFDPQTGHGTGFWFEQFSSEALHEALQRALAVWQDERAWATLVQNGMAQDFSWDRQGAEYVALYERLAPVPS